MKDAHIFTEEERNNYSMGSHGAMPELIPEKRKISKVLMPGFRATGQYIRGLDWCNLKSGKKNRANDFLNLHQN